MNVFPRQPNFEGGWVISVPFLQSILELLDEREAKRQLMDVPPSLEQIEMVLIALEDLEALKVLPQAIDSNESA